MSNAIVITIGRGAVGTPRLLGADTWSAFKGEVTEQLHRERFETVVSNDGTGTWEGQEEQNHVWVALAPEDIAFDTWIEVWRSYLSRLAARYDQDAIAFTHGESELVGRPIPGGRITGTNTSVAPHGEVPS